MLWQLLAILDKATGSTVGPIITVRHQIEATRAFLQLCLDPQTNIGKNAEDFALYLIGHYDDSTMELQPLHPAIVITAQEAIQVARRAKEEHTNVA